MSDAVEPVPAGAVAVVLWWADALAAGDFRTMWHSMDDQFRLCEAQLWIFSNQEHPALQTEDRDVLANELAQLESDHHLRGPFEEGRLAQGRNYLPSWPRDRWTVAGNRRKTAEDLDLVLILDPEVIGDEIPEGIFGDGGGVAVYVTRLSSAGWRVAGLGYWPHDPGWPPSPGGFIESEV